MAKTSFANEVIASYKKIVNLLYENKLISNYNELSEKILGIKKL